MLEYLVVCSTARLTEGGAAEMLQRLSHTYLGPDVVFPNMPEPSARADSTVVEVAASHSNDVSQPAAVADLIKKAASEVSPAAR